MGAGHSVPEGSLGGPRQGRRGQNRVGGWGWWWGEAKETARPQSAQRLPIPPSYCEPKCCSGPGDAAGTATGQPAPLLMRQRENAQINI